MSSKNIIFVPQINYRASKRKKVHFFVEKYSKNMFIDVLVC